MPRRRKKRNSGELIKKRFRRNRVAVPKGTKWGLGIAPTSRKPSGAAKAVIGRFEASVHTLALLANNVRNS